MKKLIIFSMIFTTLILSPFCIVHAETLNLVVDTVPVVYTDAFPFIENGRTMIPLRILSESMQAKVEYNEKTSSVTITRDGNCTTKATYGQDNWTYIEYLGKKYENATAVAIFTENSPEVTVKLLQGKKTIHSTKTKMDVAAKIINGRTYIPARYVAYALGYGIYYDQPRNRVLYQYKANQIADFESKAVYNKEYYDYNSITMAGREAVTNYRSWSYRDGFGNVKVVDGDNGWELYMSGGSNERSHEMANLTYMPVGYTFETKEFLLLPKNSPKKNIEIFTKMLESKTTGTVTENNGVYHLNIYTYDELVGVRYKNGKYTIGPQQEYDINKAASSGGFLAGASRYGRYDYSMFYYLDNGEKNFYEGFSGSTVDNTSSRYNLLFLESFLGEIGERIWSMMDDYYMHTGAFYIKEKCIGDNMYNFMSYKDVEITQEYAQQYGFEFVSSINSTPEYDSYKILTLKRGDFEFAVNYKRNGMGQPQVGYQVSFENLPE